MTLENNMRLDEKVAFLESLGFEIIHEISNVEHSGFRFDFSATKMDVNTILSIMLHTVYDQGKEFGKRKLQLELRNMLDCND